MKAIRLEEPGRLIFTNAEPLGVVQPDEALVRVHRIGVCGTDIHAFYGRQPLFSYPRVLGHELGVEVVEVGEEVTNVTTGDRCAVEPYLNCQKCIACRSDKPNCCIDLKVLGVHVDGGMRESFTLPARKLHPSPKLSFDELALVETLGIGAHAVARAQVQRDDFVAVLGAGPIGLTAMQFALEVGAKVIALDINEQRLNFCREQLGVPYTINAQHENPLEKLDEITNGDLPTAVFDATGNAQSMMSGFEYTAHGGRLIFISLVQADITFNDPNFHLRELTVLSSRNARPEEFTRIIHLIETKQIDISPWITHRASFKNTVHEFPNWTKPETRVLKAMIEV